MIALVTSNASYLTSIMKSAYFITIQTVIGVKLRPWDMKISHWFSQISYSVAREDFTCSLFLDNNFTCSLICSFSFDAPDVLCNLYAACTSYALGG